MPNFNVSPLPARFGVYLDADLSRPLEPDAAQELRQLFYRHGLIIARNQDVTPEAHTCLVEAIGPVPRTTHDGVTMLSNLPNPNHDGFLKEFVRSGLAFHSDDAFSPTPARAISLLAVEVTDDATSTQFASSVAACRDLPAPLHARLQSLEALHVFGRFIERRNSLRTAHTNDPHSFHPVIWAHPVTGNALLYVNYMMTDSIYGLARKESDQLLEELFGYLYAPANRYEHVWKRGDLLLWDNFALQHARGRVEPHQVGTRRLHRVVSTDKGFLEMHPQFNH